MLILSIPSHYLWGRPKDVSKSWRTTDNALENDAELRNDNYLNLDELRQAVPKAVSDIVYMLTGAQGKARGSKSGRNRENKQFNLMYTSTGEIALEDHLRRGGIEMDAGLLLRFAPIPSDAGKGYGVFERINYGNSSSDVGNRINELSAKHYGQGTAQSEQTSEPVQQTQSATEQQPKQAIPTVTDAKITARKVKAI